MPQGQILKELSPEEVTTNVNKMVAMQFHQRPFAAPAWPLKFGQKLLLVNQCLSSTPAFMWTGAFALRRCVFQVVDALRLVVQLVPPAEPERAATDEE